MTGAKKSNLSLWKEFILHCIITTVRQLFICNGFFPSSPILRGGGKMNVYEALSLMIGFGILIATIMSK
ncbi:putative holin-like toxin [uncultured Dialister sp.]|uniref:putative holin-like toxin n=1 Tax=uncultured Dialister sp. TaxID=278064 RepID=UPI0034566660